jgi:hypothetical protein
MKGILAVYVNCPPETGKSPQEIIELFMELNRPVIEEIARVLDYRVLTIPTLKESCRIEKIEMDKPFPRYAPKYHVDLEQMEKRRDERLDQLIQAREERRKNQ